MFAGIKNAVVGLLSSKKFLGTIAGLGAARLCAKVGCDPQAAKDVLMLTGGWVVSQGLADFGKHKA